MHQMGLLTGVRGHVRGILRFGVLSRQVRQVSGDIVGGVGLCDWEQGRLRGECGQLEVCRVVIRMGMLAGKI